MSNDCSPVQTISRRDRIAFYAGIIGLGIAASVTGLENGFALDDVALIAGNARVHSLDHWWRLFAMTYWPPQYGASLYRPIVTIGYALQWAAGHGTPWLFHLTSIVLYAAVSALVLSLALELIRPPAALAAAALFAAHPVHVEAVANVVGQSELLAAAATLGACVIYLRARRWGALGPRSIAWIALLFVVACLSKEHAVLLPGLLAALEWFAVGRDGSRPALRVRDRARAMAPLFATLALIVVGLVIVRTLVVGELLGEKHLVPIYGVRRLWVVLAVVPHWLRLLTWPAHLSAEYSPRQIEIPQSPGWEIAPGAAILVAVVAGFVALGLGTEGGRAERNVARVAFAWLAITLFPVSNLFSVMLVAERTLLMPSVGATLLAAAAVSALLGTDPAARVRMRPVVAVVISCAVLLGIVRSATRSRVWRDDATLFAQTVEDAPRSYRAQFFYGQLLFEQGKRGEAERRLRLAISLNPTASDVSPLNYLATQYRIAGMCPQALPLYERALANDARRPDVRYGLAECLFATGRVSEARRLAQEGAQRGDLKGLFLQLLARVDSVSSGG
jgi:hypothetical protein